MNLESMSGLEIIQAIIDGKLPHPSIAETIPMTFLEAEKGRVVFEATATEKHMNPMGGTHGGFASTVMDSVTGCAVHTMLEPGIPYGTIDLAVRMVRPIPRGVRLIAEGKIVNLSRSLGVSEGSLKDHSGKLYAHATSSCMIIRRT
ncbi:MAG: PaaI family thioesterase [bacterium]